MSQPRQWLAAKMTTGVMTPTVVLKQCETVTEINVITMLIWVNDYQYFEPETTLTYS